MKIRTCGTLIAILTLILAGCGAGAYSQYYTRLDPAERAASDQVVLRNIEPDALDGLLAGEFASHAVLGKSVVVARKAKPEEMLAQARAQGASDALWWQISLGKRHNVVSIERTATDHYTGSGARAVTMSQEMVEVHLVLLAR